MGYRPESPEKFRFIWNKPLKLEVRETLEIRVQPFSLLKGSRTQGERQVFQGRQLSQRTEF